MALRHKLFVALPTVRGVHPLTMWGVFDMRTELEKANCSLAGGSTYRMPLDLARNEMAMAYLTTSCDCAILLDDDVQIVPPEWIVKMLDALDDGCDIVSAPCRLRDFSHGGAQDWSPFNIRPNGEMVTKGGLRLLPCEQTGLGAVLVSRRVIETLYEADVKYAARLMEGRESAAIFTSQVVPATDLLEGAPPELRVYILDDVVFSLKARRAGFTIYGAIDVPTVHDGMAGCFSAELEKLERARETARGGGLVGVDGKLVKSGGAP